MHTDGKDGRPDTFHRVFVDAAAQTYWGYYVEVEPVGETGSDVLLNVLLPSLRVNGETVPATIAMADRSLRSRLVWLSLPGRGRFLLSLSPHAGHPFQKAGVVNEFGLSFSWNGDRYELLVKKQITESSGNWNLYVLGAPAGAATCR